MGGGGWGFFFQAEDGIRDLVRSRGLGDVYKRQGQQGVLLNKAVAELLESQLGFTLRPGDKLLFTSVSTHTGMRIREVEITGPVSYTHLTLPTSDLV